MQYAGNIKRQNSPRGKKLSVKFPLCFPRVCVEAPLPDGISLQVDCLVHKSQSTLQDITQGQKEVMHVQSISHWAPANIGPYSQSVKVSKDGA